MDLENLCEMQENKKKYLMLIFLFIKTFAKALNNLIKPVSELEDMEFDQRDNDLTSFLFFSWLVAVWIGSI